MAAAAPSTAPANPLEDALSKITGKSALSQDAGTNDLLSYENLGYRQPAADVINISGSPGTGASTAETWSHDIALENLKREQLQFEYEQQQNEIANALKEQEAERQAAENIRQEAQLGLTKQTTAQTLATQQQAMQSEAQRQLATAQGMQQTAQGMKYATTGEARQAAEAAQKAQMNALSMATARAEEKRKADEAAMKYGIFGSYEGMRQAMMTTGREMQETGYAPVGSPTVTAYRLATIPGYIPSYAEKLNAQQARVNYNAPSFYDPSTNRVYTAPAGSASTPAGQGYFDRATGQWAYR